MRLSKGAESPCLEHCLCLSLPPRWPLAVLHEGDNIDPPYGIVVGMTISWRYGGLTMLGVNIPALSVPPSLSPSSRLRLPLPPTVENPYRMDSTVIKNRAKLLQKYVSDEQKELQALYALQALMVKLDQPASKSSTVNSFPAESWFVRPTGPPAFP